MGYGLKIRNINSELQIDSEYVNYVYNGQSGSLDIKGLSTVNLTTPSKYPPIALIQPTDTASQGCGVFDYSYTSPNYTAIRFFGGDNVGTNNCSFNYRIYTTTGEASTADYGLRVRKADGRVIYDTEKNPFKILEVGTATVDSTYTHASHTSPYYIFSPWLSRVYGVPTGPPPAQGPVIRQMCGLAKQSTTSVKPVWITVGQMGITNMQFSDQQGTTITLLVCDPNE